MEGGILGKKRALSSRNLSSGLADIAVKVGVFPWL